MHLRIENGTYGKRKEEINKSTWEWLKDALIQECALFFFNDLGKTEWLDGFCRWHSISVGTTCGDSRDVNDKVMQNSLN